MKWMINGTISGNKHVELGNIEIYSESIPYDGVGGDIISIMEFSKLYNLDRIRDREKKRIDTFVEQSKDSGISMDAEPLKTMYGKYMNRLQNIELNYSRIGIIVGDVMGHGSENSAIARDLSKWLELAADFEIERYGQITERAIEKINNMFNKDLESNNKKYVTMIYGEIYTDGTFRFVSAGHPKPVIYSKEFGRIIPLPDDIIDPGFPLGLRPSDDINNLETYLGYEPEYHVNTMKLESPGDIFILHTDGLSEHKNLQSIDYHPKEGISRLEEVLKRTNHLSAKDISKEIKRDLRTYGKIEDDVSYVIIKKTA